MQNNQFDTLSEALSDLEKRGYTYNFNIKPDAIECKALDQDFDPNDFEVDEFHRFEGMSNPDDMSIVFAISTSNNSIKGTLVDAYGTYSDPLSADMIQKLKIS
jgi:hypothetical protein